MSETITTYRAGKFAQEAAPEWLVKMRTEQRLEDYRNAKEAAIGRPFWSESIDDDGGDWKWAEVDVYRTPDGGVFVDLWNASSGTEFLIPDEADWWPFNCAHVEPFLAARAAMAQAARLTTIGNSLIAYFRHGEGKHIDRNDGLSSIDEQQDEADRRRWEAAANAKRAATP